jgi:hypothetical protein
LLAGLILIFLRIWLWGAVATFAGLAAIVSIRKTIGSWNLGQLKWELTDEISPGENCTIRVCVGPGRLTAVRAVELRLRALEIVCTGPEKKRKRFQHQIFCGDYPLKIQSAPGCHGELEFATDFRVPDIPAWSIDLPGNQIVWRARLTVRQSWWPKWIETREIQFIPGTKEQNAVHDVSSSD